MSCAGLVQVAQGGGTRVLDFRRHAGLDLVALLAEHPRSDNESLAFWFSVLEVRAGQARDIARLCALRASTEVKQQLVELAHEMQATTNDDSLYAHEVQFWDRAIEGAGNIVYRLSFNSMTRAAQAMGDEAKRWSVREVKAAKYRVPLAAAIASGNASAAEAKVRASMQAGLDALAAFLKRAPTTPARRKSIAT
jgi:GntR family transcriptional repressor for pyruvate dehydrogenase complex